MRKLVYLSLLALIAILVVSISYKLSSQTIFSQIKMESKQDVVKIGDVIDADFYIFNPSQEQRMYTYSVYLNDEKQYESTVTIKPNKRFVFGGHYPTYEPGLVKITALVYDGDNEVLLENITYFVTVK